jgi:hypothetical protein
MSYPPLTRLGLSQFWYKHWFTNSPSLLQENIQQDKLMESLIELYLNYGLTPLVSPFRRKYWFIQSNNSRNQLFSRSNQSKFYRRFYYTNDILSIEHSFLVRHVAAEHFPLRLWVLKYHGWIILSFKCFKPNKSSTNRARIQPATGLNLIPAIHTYWKNQPTQPIQRHSRRLRLVIFFLKLRHQSYLQQNYNF